MTALGIDWGNTRIKIAVFKEGGAIAENHVWSEGEALQNMEELIKRHQPIASILCSVVKHPEELETILKTHTRFVKLESATWLPIMNAYHSPATLGPDRLAVAVAAQHQFPDKNNLVISAGTCITYNFVLKNRTFRGGAISPGLRMRLQAMHHFTDLLPEVSPEGDLLLLGYDTETSMRSGAIYGTAAEIEGMLQAYAGEYPDFNAVLTGGDAPMLARQMKSKIFADPDLTLKGLYLILKHNVPQLR